MWTDAMLALVSLAAIVVWPWVPQDYFDKVTKR